AGGVAGAMAAPAEPARGKTSTRRGQDAAATAGRAAAPTHTTESGGGVAVLDEEVDEPEVRKSSPTREASAPISEAVETTEPSPPSDSAEPDRPRTPPTPGSAAERAAARRARMRAERGQG
ncbi:MAG TPA: hypothetical protein VNB91_05030, partial [Jatrophihabitantaceae bacterium]|nr:hypothetical protein [Jatrophihabitantaceae bacterium]